jgi:energy-coupling factor transporter ATP-binding protein EcfA2
VAWSWQVPRRWQRPGPAAAPADRAAIAAAGLSKYYGRGLALAGLDLRVAAGETVALLGPDGAGKSTAIGLLLGLLGPDRGRVRVYDRPPSQAVAGGLAGAMLQDAGLMPGVRVGELLAMVGACIAGRCQQQSWQPWLIWARCWAGGPTGCPAARRSGCGLPPRSPGIRSCCCSTSPPLRWMSRAAGTSGPRFTASPPAGAPCCSPSTTCRRPTMPQTGWS